MTAKKAPRLSRTVPKVGVSRDALRRQREREAAAKQEGAKRAARTTSSRFSGAVVRHLGGPEDGRLTSLAKFQAYVASEEYFGHTHGYRLTTRSTRLPDKLREFVTAETATVVEWVGPTRKTYGPSKVWTRIDCKACGHQLLHPETRRRELCLECGGSVDSTLPAGWGE